MAYDDSTALTGDELAAFQGDKPMIVGRNWLRESGISLEWNDGGTWADNDETDSDGPKTYAYDDYDHLQTYPDAAKATWYLLIDLGTAREVDTIALLNPSNLNGVQITTQIGDDNAYSSTQTLDITTPSDAKRVILVDLHHSGSVPMRYTGAQYYRLKFYDVGTVQPKIGELIVGRRRQLLHNPDVGWDKNNLRSLVAEFESDSGIISSYARHTRRRYIDATVPEHTSTPIADIEALYTTDTTGMSYPVLWIDEPTTDPTAAYWIKMTPELSGPIRGYNERVYRFVGREHGPNFYELGV